MRHTSDVQKELPVVTGFGAALAAAKWIAAAVKAHVKRKEVIVRKRYSAVTALEAITNVVVCCHVG